MGLGAGNGYSAAGIGLMEAGTIFNNISSGIQSAISTLNVHPIQGYNPVNPSSAPSSQYLSNTLTKPLSTYN